MQVCYLAWRDFCAYEKIIWFMIFHAKQMAPRFPLCFRKGADQFPKVEWTRRVIVQNCFVFNSTMTQVQEGVLFWGAWVFCLYDRVESCIMHNVLLIIPVYALKYDTIQFIEIIYWQRGLRFFNVGLVFGVINFQVFP